jgi:hypothetical protein
MNEKSIARFWIKVDKNGPTIREELGSCWVWTAYVGPNGYGYFGLSGPVPRLAHRVSWLIEHGSWPHPCALHRCDNRVCVRPAHLFEGTQLDNVRDCLSKNRQRRPRGEAYRSAKLTDDTVREVRFLACAGHSQRAIAARFGIHPSVISRILSGRSWAHVV